MRAVGNRALVEFFGGWLSAFPDAQVEVHDVYFIDHIAVEEGTFSGSHDACSRLDRRPTGRPGQRGPDLDGAGAFHPRAR
ncbi:MAG: hypothetical protein JO262_19955 [Solirubrobacterales bacterium]|nr:hypothetical protein [Solirubrobacterales bacterium]MBV9338503.1 hypothetical protein [Solirubrobacterales bacterium]MBV9944413.1 hypothetical protein [Solirubrobacterales bacterium]